MNNHFYIGTLQTYGDAIIHTDDNLILLATYYDRSRTKARSVGAQMGIESGGYTVSFLSKKFRTLPGGYKAAYRSMTNGRDRFSYCYAVSNKVNNEYIITSNESLYHDLYEYLLTNYSLPLLERWMPYLFEAGTELSFFVEQKNCLTAVEKTRRLWLHGTETPVSSFRVIKVAMTDKDFKDLISTGLKKKSIWISEKSYPALSYSGFNDYISRYGQGLVNNLEREITPLTALNGSVSTLALKEKSLFPQQAACVNGILALQKSGAHYGFLNEGMGVGKTLQGMSVVEAAEVEKWLRAHPGKTLKDAYATEEIIRYRCIIMAPGHLVNKWAEEIRKEIPYAKAVIINEFNQLIELREHKKPIGKEFFIISKDFCKLGTELSPIPTAVKYHRKPAVVVCKDCLEEGNNVKMAGPIKKRYCPSCHGKKALILHDGSYDLNGMICPSCGEILTKHVAGELVGLSPADFAFHNNQNDICYTCGAPLWGANVRNIGNDRAPKWYKIRHYANFKRKSTKNPFVLKGFEHCYTEQITVQEDITVSSRVYGARKYAPSAYISKYLKGYFDYCILDECHKYEGAGTAQANAAHALSRASKFTLGLTGTISNGTAGSFFYLLFMLDPQRMKNKGYSYTGSDYMNFCKKYGTVETVYELKGSQRYNTMSRGAMKEQPKVKAGISPLLYAEFLVDRCVMLDISDLSKYLPPLKEFVRLVEFPDSIYSSYWGTLQQIKAALHEKAGSGLMGAISQFGLSYPDKPYGRKHIYSLVVDDLCISSVANFPQYDSLDCLLPKEQELVDIINQEKEEGRNCFVYCSFTGEEESNIVRRLQRLVERYCNLTGRVQIIQASSPAPIAREEWMHQKAAEGMKVFICNPKVVETGLDFAFDYKGKSYNYPTIIFFQTNHELAVMWQASRRSYRLNQPLESRIYWLAYEGTLQATALESMGDKMVATSAIQGKFSAEGLAAMSKSVDPRVRMAEALASGDTADRDTLNNMFDILNQSNNDHSDTDDLYGATWIKTTNFYDLLGLDRAVTSVWDEIDNETDLFSFLSTSTSANEATAEISPVVSTAEKQEEAPIQKASDDKFFGDIFASDGLFIFNEELYTATQLTKKTGKKKKKADSINLVTLFDIL